MVRGKKLVGKDLLNALGSYFHDPRYYRPNFREISTKLGIHETTVHKYYSSNFDSLRDGFILNQQTFIVESKDLSVFIEVMTANKHRITGVEVVSPQKFNVKLLLSSSIPN